MSIRIDASSDIPGRTSTLPATQVFTWMGWVYLTTDRNALGNIFVLYNHVSAPTSWAQLYLRADGTTLGSDVSGNVFDVGSGLSVTTWAHVAYTYNGTTALIYVNAALVGTHTTTSSFTPALLALGSNGSIWMDGRLGCIKMWSAALTLAEIQAEKNRIDAVRASNIWAIYPTYSADRYTDYSANVNNLSDLGGTGTVYEDQPPGVTWGSGGIAGTAALTQASNALAASSTLRGKGVLSAAQAANSLSAAAALKLAALLSASQSPHTLLATGVGTVSSSGVLSGTQASHLLVAAGALKLAAAAAINQAANSLSSAGRLAGTGVGAINQADNSLSSVASLALLASATLAQAPHTLAATGAGPVANAGVLSVAQASNTLSVSAALAVRAAAALTQDSHTISALAALAVTGTLSKAQAANTLAASGVANLVYVIIAASVAAPGSMGRIGAPAVVGGVHAPGSLGSLRG